MPYQQNNNPYYVSPSNDLSRGMQGLSAGLQSMMGSMNSRKAQESEQAQADAEQAQLAEVKRLGLEAYQSGDPEKIRRFMVQYPEYGQKVWDASEIRSKESGAHLRKAMDLTAQNWEDPKTVSRIVDSRRAYLESIGQSPEEMGLTNNFADEYSKDPKKAMAGLTSSYAALFPNEFGNFRMMNPDLPGMPVKEQEPAKRQDKLKLWDEAMAHPEGSDERKRLLRMAGALNEKGSGGGGGGGRGGANQKPYDPTNTMVGKSRSKTDAARKAITGILQREVSNTDLMSVLAAPNKREAMAALSGGQDLTDEQQSAIDGYLRTVRYYAPFSIPLSQQSEQEVERLYDILMKHYDGDEEAVAREMAELEY